ncbi:MAG TPA: amidohydrolase family protein [Syntrophales bacterium]|jgi:predicted TIM-barrel fold metal-dependent hydrolase|nr:amidohydrolase family protein [Syntrophales bacterium]
MVIDCHYHLEERLLSVNELLQKMDQSGVDKTALMGLQIDPYPEPSRLLISLLQVLLFKRPFRRIGKSFIANFTNNGIKILGNNYPLRFDPDNEPVFNLVRAHPDRFLGWVFVNPKGKKNPVAEFEKWKTSSGCIGVKAHAFWNHHTPLELKPVAEKAAAAGLPLIIHLGYGLEGDYPALLDAVPGLKLIIAHAGFPGYADTWKDIVHRENVYVDLSQTSYVGVNILKSAVEYLGAERCVFGTDGPYGFHGKDGKFDYGLIKRRIETIFTDSGIRKRLLGENFQELSGIT